MEYLRFRFAFFCSLLLLLAAVLGWAQPVRAHAEIERSEPAADAIIPAAPAEVHIWFTQELFRRKGSNVIEVSGPNGDRVDQGETQIDDDDRKHTFISLQPDLPAGLYTVSWHTLSVEDGHEGSGEFSFTIKPAAGEAVPQASPSTTQALVAITPTQPSTPTSASTPTPVSPASGGLPCFGGLLLGGMLLAALTSGQPKRGIG